MAIKHLWWALVGLSLAACGGGHSTPTTPTLASLADDGHVVVQTANGQSCIPQGQPIPPGATVVCDHHCPPPAPPPPHEHHPSKDPHQGGPIHRQ